MKRVIALILVLLVTGVCFGTENEMLLGHLTKLVVDEETLNAELAEPFFSLTPFTRFKYFNTIYGMIAALMSGRIAALEIDKYTADYLISRTKQYAVFGLPKTSVYNVKFSMLLREEDAEFCERISSAIRDMKSDGTLAAMKKKYIDDYIAGTDPETVKPEHFDGALTFKVALTGDHPPMDYFADAGDPIGFNTALVSEIAKRLKMNAVFISVHSGARAICLESKACDVVFWTEEVDYKDREGWELDDRPEHTLVTEPYLDSTLTYVTMSDSPLLKK
ncbi:MAG: transporter substrate-binding domain-containing protein [Synergistaceae bacterium]|nr:transporter substrate-binding domain-containing protein [Synergistaceae bacterium]